MTSNRRLMEGRNEPIGNGPCSSFICLGHSKTFVIMMKTASVQCFNTIAGQQIGHSPLKKQPQLSPQFLSSSCGSLRRSMVSESRCCFFLESGGGRRARGSWVSFQCFDCSSLLCLQLTSKHFPSPIHESNAPPPGEVFPILWTDPQA